MRNFNTYLEKSKEVGFVEEVRHTVIHVDGLPQAHANEIVVFEGGQVGRVLSLHEGYLEVLLLSRESVDVGTRVARTGELLKVGVSEEMLGAVIDPLGAPLIKSDPIPAASEFRNVDQEPLGINERVFISEPFETGVAIVDLVVPLGKGQRELVIGDRKIGKTQFLFQACLSQARKGSICIYAAIGKRKSDIAMITGFFETQGIRKQSIIVTTTAEDPTGLIFLTPYTAMTLAEYFRDQGRDVLVIMDDLTAHAKFYRELTLLARRFPGRSSYPGDIFYIHSRLLERAGKFTKGSITCLPVAETVIGDVSGYIQTNIMSMTDGHIFFDYNLYAQGKRPAVNPFLSVTRVGLQAQSPLVRNVTRELESFLVRYDRLKQFMHFGAELSDEVRQTIQLGDKITAFFEQSDDRIIPLPVNLLLIGWLWGGMWKQAEPVQMKTDMQRVINAYLQNSGVATQINGLVTAPKNFPELLATIKQHQEYLLGLLRTA